MYTYEVHVLTQQISIWQPIKLYFMYNKGYNRTVRILVNSSVGETVCLYRRDSNRGGGMLAENIKRWKNISMKIPAECMSDLTVPAGLRWFHRVFPGNHCGWLGPAMVLGSFQCRGVLLLSHMVGQGPAVLAAGAGLMGYFYLIFHLVYPIFLL